VIGNQFTTDLKLRVIAEGSACASPTTPAHKARKENGMKNCNAPENQTTRHVLLIACATALAVAFTVSLPQPAHADHVTLPPVPPNIQVPAGNKAFLEAHAVGTQDYICLPSGSGFALDILRAAGHLVQR
jgi:hypothetical protein